MKKLYCQKQSTTSNLSFLVSRLSSLFSLLLIANMAIGQFLEQSNLPVYGEDDNLIPLALAGGVNNPQLSEVDWNNDGIQDLFIFDREGDVPMAFLNQGTANQPDYHFGAAYVRNFPPVRSWAMMRDYDCDGVMDLFAYNRTPASGIRVYRGHYEDDSSIMFTLVEDFLEYPTFNGFLINIYVSSEDFPAIDDIDGDGDLDVLTFDVGGGWVSYFENQSQDMGYGCDSLIFELVDDCWGRFYESGVTNALELSPEPDSCIDRETYIGQPFAPETGIHAGSTVLTFDLDADGDKEIALGDISFTKIVVGYNGGTADTAWITSQDPNFTSYDVSVDLPSFPAAFYLDVNNDGAKDLLAAPNRENSSINYENIWFYENMGTTDMPVFDLQMNDFLVRDMLDFGTGTSPVFFDHNADGLMDLVVGTYGYYQPGGNYKSSILLYENIGTMTDPEFKLIDINYTNLPDSNNLRAFDIAFGDLDGDGDKDMVLGEEFGKLFYYENLDNGNGIANFQDLDTLDGDEGDGEVGQIDIGQHSTPALVDMNQDGLLDLVIGEKNGNLNYWENTGTANAPFFLKTDDFFGGIDCREFGYPEGFCDVAIKQIEGEYVLFTGSESGNIRRYKGIDQSFANGQPFIKADSLYGHIVQGRRTRIAVEDITGDGIVDFVLGNQRGGLAFYPGEFFVSNDTPDIPDFTFNIFPNPTSNLLNINYVDTKSSIADLSIFDVLGRNIYQDNIRGNTQLDVSDWSGGIYFCRIQVNNQSVVKKFIKK